MALSDIIGGIFGGSAGKSDMKNAQGLSAEAVAALKRIYTPTVSEQEVALTAPELAGLLEAQQIDGSGLEQVSTDPRLKNSQLKALEQLAGLSEQGLGPEDRAAFNQLQREASAQAQAQNAQVLQNAAARGTLDSGSTLLSQLLSGQQAANRSQQSGEQIAAQASQARRQALGQYADLSSNIANQDFNQKAQIANARDTINQFNAQNRQRSGEINLTNKQNLANEKANIANKQQMYNKGLIQDRFNNELAKATGVANQSTAAARTASEQGSAAAQGQSQMMGSLIGAGASLGAAYVGKK